MKRRTTLKLISSLPVLAAFPAMAADKKAKAELIDEKDTLAAAMQYKHDATKVGPMRADKKAICLNCSKYNKCMDGDSSCKPLAKKDLAKADAAPCQIFKGKVVKAKGWCLSWSKA